MTLSYVYMHLPATAVIMFYETVPSSSWLQSRNYGSASLPLVYSAKKSLKPLEELSRPRYTPCTRTCGSVGARGVVCMILSTVQQSTFHYTISIPVIKCIMRCVTYCEWEVDSGHVIGKSCETSELVTTVYRDIVVYAFKKV